MDQYLAIDTWVPERFIEEAERRVEMLDKAGFLFQDISVIARDLFWNSLR